MNAPAPNRDEAERFLTVLDANAASFTFQTFDDDKERRNPKLVRILHGSLSQHFETLQQLNTQGAGVFITVNETDGKGRAAENITRVRAQFVDLDGAPLEAVLQAKLPPHIVVESSPSRWHAYWLVENAQLDEFKPIQEALSARFNSDPSVKDLPRCMRLPGFLHRKGEPFQTRIKSTSEAAPYQAAVFELPKGKAEPWDRDTPATHAEADPETVAEYQDLLSVIDPDIEYGTWWSICCALVNLLGFETGKQVAIEWSAGGRKFKRGELERKLKDIDAKNAYGYGRQTIVNAWALACEARTPEAERQQWQQNVDAIIANAKKKAERQLKELLQSSHRFVTDFVPPEYLIDGILQRRFCYSMTGMTGIGKTSLALRIAAHVAHGLPLANRAVEQGRVLYLAGENPDDVRMRWIKLCEEMGLNAYDENIGVVFLPGTPPIFSKEVRARIDAEAATQGPFSLVIVDTSAAYFTGADENSIELARHARDMRSLVALPGGPTVLATTHPVKNPDFDNLLPRGGGGFLNEVDGNLVCLKEGADSDVVVVHWHGKWRGPEFEPFSFRLRRGTSDNLVDRKGHYIWTVYAEPISEAERSELAEEGADKLHELLRMMLTSPNASLAELGDKMGWVTRDGKPVHKMQVQRVMQELCKRRWAIKEGAHYTLTNRGKQAAEALVS